MNRLSEMARLGSNFDRALADAIAQQTPNAKARILAALDRGDFEVAVDGTPPLITLRISGDVLLECQIYPERADVRSN